MGTFASYDDVHHGTEAYDLAEYCTACRSTGWVDYPRTLLEIEQDACPYGCMDKDELLDMGYQLVLDTMPEHLAQYLAISGESYPALPDEYDVLYRQALRETEAAPDPFLSLSQQFRLRGLKRYESITPHHHGMVSSDDYIPGFMRSGRRVVHISIPPYLVGQVQDWDAEYAEIEYEYVGSRLTVFVSTHTLLKRMRFAYSWDRDYRTSTLLA